MAGGLRILVVGAGIAGLSAAIALQRAGLRPELVEARADALAEGAAITLHANGVRALRGLGLGPGLDAAAAVVPRWSFRTATGQELCSTDLTDLWDGVAPCLGVTRARLHGLLHAGAAAVPQRWGVRVIRVESDAGGVDVHLSDGTYGRYDLVVGADGIRSTVRALALDPAPPRYCGVVGWRSVVGGRPPGGDHLVLLLGDGRFFGLVPLGDGYTYGFAGIAAPTPLEDTPAGRLDRLRTLFAGFADPVATYLASLDVDEQVHQTPIERVELDRWHAGRIVVVGDAAHAMPPHMGEGGCLAVEDGAVLAEELACAENIEAALNRYAARRRPRIEWVREQTRLAAAAWVLPAEVRDAALRARGDAALRARYAPLRTAP